MEEGRAASHFLPDSGNIDQKQLTCWFIQNSKHNQSMELIILIYLKSLKYFEYFLPRNIHTFLFIVQQSYYKICTVLRPFFSKRCWDLWCCKAVSPAAHLGAVSGHSPQGACLLCQWVWSLLEAIMWVVKQIRSQCWESLGGNQQFKAWAGSNTCSGQMCHLAQLKFGPGPTVLAEDALVLCFLLPCPMGGYCWLNQTAERHSQKWFWQPRQDPAVFALWKACLILSQVKTTHTCTWWQRHRTKSII